MFRITQHQLLPGYCRPNRIPGRVRIHGLSRTSEWSWIRRSPADRCLAARASSEHQTWEHGQSTGSMSSWDQAATVLSSKRWPPTATQVSVVSAAYQPRSQHCQSNSPLSQCHSNQHSSLFFDLLLNARARATFFRSPTPYAPDNFLSRPLRLTIVAPLRKG